VANAYGDHQGLAPKLVGADGDDPEIVALGRYLGMDGKMGYVPDWYYLLRASDRLHAPAWDVLEHSIWYQDIALKAIAAENAGENIKAQHHR
jgi:hypothetical protein